MNLIVDIGNTVLKAAVADGVTLGKTYRYQGEKGIDFIVDLASDIHPEKTVVCSARALSDTEIGKLDGSCGNLVVIDPQHKDIAHSAMLPEYITPASVASVIAVRHLFKGKGCSIFDFGTMITSMFLDEAGRYLGGNISPGCTTRFRSISRYAKNLPLLTETEDIQQTGNSLNSSIRSGVVSGIMFEIEGYMSLYPENMCVFTGGDAIYFAKRTKNSIFVVCNLVLMGLALVAQNNENRL